LCPCSAADAQQLPPHEQARSTKAFVAAIGCPDLPGQAQANCGNPAIKVMSAVVPIKPARKTLGT